MPQVTIVGIILLTAVVNVFVGSASAKWALLSSIFVPMLMDLGIAPELTQAAYRVGDSVTNIVTPLLAGRPAARRAGQLRLSVNRPGRPSMRDQRSFQRARKGAPALQHPGRAIAIGRSAGVGCWWMDIDKAKPARLLVVSLSALVLMQCVAAVDTVQRPDVVQVDVSQLGIAQLRLAAGQGDARAQTELGARYESGRGVEQDYRAALAWYRRAADQGYAPGQAALGFLYSTGRGVERNDAVATSWHRRAAEQGNARAQNNLGIQYRNGHGVARDDAEAVRWFRRAAEQGNGFAENSLGEMYRDGRGVAPDDEEAARWFRRAAEQGHAFAQTNLGFLYE